MSVDPGIAIEVVAAVKHALIARGFDVEQALARPGALVVGGSVANSMLDEAAATLGDPALGLTLAATIPIGALTIVDYALVTSATMRESLQRVTEHYGLVTQRVRVALVEGDGTAALIFSRSPGVHQSRHWNEFALAMFALRMRQTLATDLTFDASFIHAPPGDPAVHARYFGGRVTFGADQDRLGFDPGYLDRALVTASGSLASLLDARMRALEPAFAIVDPLVESARLTLSAMLDEKRTELEELARRLGTSTRTLQRTLGKAGTSHSELLDQLRRERAGVLLQRGLRVAEVSDALAFSAPSAFFRAYRRWTGTSPRGSARDDDGNDDNNAE